MGYYPMEVVQSSDLSGRMSQVQILAAGRRFFRMLMVIRRENGKLTKLGQSILIPGESDGIMREEFAIIMSEDEESIIINLDGYDNPDSNVVKVEFSSYMFLSTDNFSPHRQVTLTYPDLTTKKVYLDMEEQQNASMMARSINDPPKRILHLIKEVAVPDLEKLGNKVHSLRDW